jgi:hypothetical protein
MAILERKRQVGARTINHIACIGETARQVQVVCRDTPSIGAELRCWHLICPQRGVEFELLVDSGLELRPSAKGVEVFEGIPYRRKWIRRNYVVLECAASKSTEGGAPVTATTNCSMCGKGNTVIERACPRIEARSSN